MHVNQLQDLLRALRTKGEFLEAPLWAVIAAVYPVKVTVYLGRGSTVFMDTEGMNVFQWAHPGMALTPIRASLVSQHYRAIVTDDEVRARAFHLS